MRSYPKITILGMMSGTSMDGVDCIISKIKINDIYKLTFEIIEQKTIPIPNELRNKIELAVENPHLDYHSLCDEIGKFYSSSAMQLNNTKNLNIISIHGQTIFHEEKVKSIQIGNPYFLSKQFNIPVIHQFRIKDINAGGTGAPLMPFLDWLLLKNSNQLDFTLNIGGISNITVVSKNGSKNEVIGFDTGPGMALIDEYCNQIWGEPFDNNAKFSKNGKIIYELLDYLMSHPFIQMEFPKSTGRDIFGKNFILEIIKLFNQEKPENILRTFVAFTAKSISINLNKVRNFIKSEYRLFISGGGIHHPLLIKDLKDYTQIKHIYHSDILGIHPDYKEAFLMAVLGYTHFVNLTNNMPSVTGAKKNVVLGEKYNP